MSRPVTIALSLLLSSPAVGQTDRNASIRPIAAQSSREDLQAVAPALDAFMQDALAGRV